MNYNNFRAMMETGYDPAIGQRVMTIQEAVQKFQLLDEAFLGRRPVKPIQDAMDKCYTFCMTNRTGTLMNTPEAKALEKALCDVFGFKSASIVWGNRPGMRGPGPCTVPSCHMLDAHKVSYRYGANSKGFYDKNHYTRIYVYLDQILFTDFGITSEEMTALLLHELGHNFDYSVFNVMGTFVNVFMDIANMLLIPTQQNMDAVVRDGAQMFITMFGRDVYMRLMNLDVYLGAAIPPLAVILRLYNTVASTVSKLLNLLLSPLQLFSLPAHVIMAPFNYMGRLLARKKEVYADSFAATYGYGPEIATALDKVFEGTKTFDTNDPITGVFYDLAMLNNEVFQICNGGHGSNQQRAIRMASKLDDDLNQSGISSTEAAAIRRERDRLMETYDKMVNDDSVMKHTLTRCFRQMIDNWHDGKGYMFFPILMEDETYAK